MRRGMGQAAADAGAAARRRRAAPRGGGRAAAARRRRAARLLRARRVAGPRARRPLHPLRVQVRAEKKKGGPIQQFCCPWQYRLHFW